MKYGGYSFPLGNKAGYKHGLSHHYLYRTWDTMKRGCINPTHAKYYLYGARGIYVCDRWLNSFPNFLEDMGDRPEGCCPDRIDNNGPYSPENCRWATYSEQNSNRRTYNRRRKIT